MIVDIEENYDMGWNSEKSVRIRIPDSGVEFTEPLQVSPQSDFSIDDRFEESIDDAG